MTAGPGTRRSMRAEFYCGALTRRKRRCRLYKMRGRPRCKFHGGYALGPTTEAGKARIAEAQRRAWAAWRQAMGLPPEWRSIANQVCRQKRKRLGLTAAAYLEKHGRHGPEDEG